MTRRQSVHDYVCHRIRSLRERKGWTASGFAQRLNLPRTYYVSMETGAYNMKLEYLQRAVEALQVDIGDVWPPRMPTISSNGRSRETERRRLQQLVTITRSSKGMILRIDETRVVDLLSHGFGNRGKQRLLARIRQGRIFEKGLWFAKEGRKGKYYLFLSACDIDVSLTHLVNQMLLSSCALFDFREE